jgi:hypothetical protein
LKIPKNPFLHACTWFVTTKPTPEKDENPKKTKKSPKNNRLQQAETKLTK